jgi:HAE1 family hydrophobic/amphiphilic exporter-1
MKEVLAPVMSITVVLMAVFVPTAFLPGISGQLFRQFALTIAASTFLSGVCAITLTPALCGVILRAHKEGHKPFILVRWFNTAFDALALAYARLIKFLVHPGIVAFTLAGFAACVLATGWTFTKVPTGFVPLEDRGMVDRCLDARFSSQERPSGGAESREDPSEIDGVRNSRRSPASDHQ